MLTATFVMEQHIGHRAYYENLRRFTDALPHVRAQWVEVTYRAPGSRWAQMPFVPERVRGSLIGRDQVRHGIAQHPADILLFSTQVPAVLAGGVIRTRPYVLCTDITPLQYDGMAEHYGHHPDRLGLIKRYKQWVNAQVLRGAALVIPWSQWAARSICADYGVDEARVTVIAPGVDLALWHPTPRVEDGPLQILFVGGDLARKGGEDLLAAFRALAPGSAELHLVTRAPLPPEPGVRVYNDLRPNSPELIALYRACDLFVLPTKAEAFGIAAVEASAAGLPVIATAVGGLTDIVIDGETGLHMPPGDVAMLTRHLRLLIEDPALRRRLGLAARARAEARFDARVNAARIVDLLQEIVARTPPHPG